MKGLGRKKATERSRVGDLTRATHAMECVTIADEEAHGKTMRKRMISMARSRAICVKERRMSKVVVAYTVRFTQQSR